MPTYEYACQSCGHKFDIWQEVGSAAPPCETCGESVKKVFHPPRVIFKGSGFYVTDLRSEKEAQSKKSSGDAGESKSGESKGDTGEKSSEKSESKSESSAASASKSDNKSSSGESKSDSKPSNSPNSSAPSKH